MELATPAHQLGRMAQPITPESLQQYYIQLIAGQRAWLSYHLSRETQTPFGTRLLNALAACEVRESGLGRDLVRGFAEIRYVPAAHNLVAWKAGFEQLIQKFAELLVCRVLCEIPWPDVNRIECEPKNPRTGARPEFVVYTPSRTWLFEVKCPAFVKHQENRRANPAQLPVRSFLRDIPFLEGAEVTLPRDNVIKDFLASAERKFAGFNEHSRTGILVVVWDTHMYEAVSVLAHDEVGLLTENSWLQKEGARVPFSSVDGVIVINRQEELKAAAQERYDCLAADPFAIVREGSLPNVWCPNVGVGELDPLIAQAFDAWPVDAVGIASDYAKMDFVTWLR